MYMYIFESQDESQTNLIQKFEFEPNQMVVELEFEFEFEPCDLAFNMYQFLDLNVVL